MSSLKVIVLDFDGVCVESVGIKDKAFIQLFKDYPNSDEIIDYCLGANSTIRFKKFEHIYTNILKQEYTKKIADKLAKEFSELVFKNVIVAPEVEGTTEFLKTFSDNVPLYMASINPADELDSILQERQIACYFKDIYAVPWKKVDALRDISVRESCSVDEIVFVGDSPEDYFAAQAAEVPFVGRFSNKPLDEYDIPVYENLHQIKEFLNSKMIAH